MAAAGAILRDRVAKQDHVRAFLDRHSFAAVIGPGAALLAANSALKAIDPDELSPKAALEALYTLRRLLNESSLSGFTSTD